ncbi:chromosome segregation protein Csm1/Pcs1-domain-containing protein [Aspergillus desertorum]
MPKRKATTRLSGLIGSDDEDVMQPSADPAQNHDERPTKKARGRPRSKSAEMKVAEAETPATQVTEPTTRRGTRRGRPKRSGNPEQMALDETEDQEKSARAGPDDAAQEADGIAETAAPPDRITQTSKPTRTTKGGGAARGKKKASAQKQMGIDDEFQYNTTGAQRQKTIEKPEKLSEPTDRKRQKSATAASEEHILDAEPTAQELVEETIIQEEASNPASPSPEKRKQFFWRAAQSSPPKRKSGAGDEKGTELELRRRLGDLTKKYDTLENRYRTLKEIGIVEANANMEKLKKQCESMANASNNLVNSLKAELEAQRALGQKSRALQKELRERDSEVAKLAADAEQSASLLAAAQSEVKALQTKLAAARNTVTTLEQAAVKVPGSAIKGGSVNRAAAAANAEAAQAAQFAQLKEDLYSDLTGLIIRDVKKRAEDSLYDCIQTGVNGTLHFKLVVPHTSPAEFETAEFQYIPLLDANRDRELVDILPEYLTVDITFVRQQASKFYTRVMDALTKRRQSQG